MVPIDKRMAKILLTGAAGFIGYNAYRQLSLDHDVVALDNFSTFSNYQIKLDRLQDLTGDISTWTADGKLINDKHKFYRCDIADMNQIKGLFEAHKFDIVIHLAAMTGVRQSITQPEAYKDSNITGFQNVLECCRIYDVKRLVYASSSSVYGGSTDTPFRESAVIDKLLNYYAVTKRENEQAAERYSSLYGMEVIGLRFFTVYGPWTRPDMATYTFMDNIITGKPISLFNHGNMERDFTFVGDVVESLERITMKLQGAEHAASHFIYNIGEGKPVNLRNYVQVLESKLHKKAIIENAPMNEGEMLLTFADCTRLFEFIGYKPRTTVEDGLEKTVEWFLKYRATKMKQAKSE